MSRKPKMKPLWLSKVEEKGKLVRADETQVGDEVCFANEYANYFVEELSVSRLGLIVHRSRSGTSYHAYSPNVKLRIRRITK